MERIGIHLERVRVERFFEATDPILAAGLGNEFEVGHVTVHLGQTAFGIVQQAIDTLLVADVGKSRVTGGLDCRISIQERSRIDIVICLDTIGKHEPTAGEFHLANLLAQLHEQTMQRFLHLVERERELVQLFNRGRRCLREARLDGFDKPTTAIARRHKRLDDVTEREERNSTAERLVACRRQAVRFVENDMLVRREERKVESEVGKEQRMVHQKQVCT